MVGVCFSGGLDSGTLAQVIRKFSTKAVLVVVGTPGSVDVGRAEFWSKKWKMRLVKKELSPEKIKENYALAGTILEKKDHIQQTLGAVNLSIAQLAHENGIKTLFVGSGADELFCGYGAFEKCRNNPIECERLRKEKVENVEAHDVMREKKCADHYGITLHAPYLDAEFAKEALKIPAIQNLQGKYGKWRKNALRTLAEKMGVPEEIVTAPKKAMQYGSGVAKVVKKASMNGLHPA